MNTVYITKRAEWRSWLAAHHATAKDVWLISYRKHLGRPGISYSVSVEEALCFGWIDSVRRSLDDERLAQRFSPRRPGSPYSQPNIERVRRLADAGMVQPDVLDSLGDVLRQPFLWPPDIMTALRSDPAAWEHFERFPAPYRRIRVAYVEAARDRPEEFEKRLGNLVRKTAAGKQFGHGIDDFY